MTYPSLRRARRRTAALAVLIGLGASVPALADGERKELGVPLLPLYRQECASCHLAYPPGLLPAASWRRLMETLPTHFGSDASLDPDSVRALSGWLQAHAARATPAAAPENRITRSRWFLREHDEIDASVWKRPSVRSPAHCAACHGGAEQGDFHERHIRIPR